MPRDRKGRVFEIGSRVRATDGTEFTVCGFLANKKHIGVSRVKELLKGCCPHVYSWKDLDVLTRHTAMISSETDRCPNDLIQSVYPEGTDVNGIPVMSMMEDDKIVWGD